MFDVTTEHNKIYRCLFEVNNIPMIICLAFVCALYIIMLVETAFADLNSNTLYLAKAAQDSIGSLMRRKLTVLLQRTMTAAESSVFKTRTKVRERLYSKAAIFIPLGHE
jgi:hypothetical protein